MSVCLFVRLLLGRPRGRARKTPYQTRFHGNHHVVMATKKNQCFYGQISTLVEYKIACDIIIRDVTSLMTSYVTSPWQWRHGNYLLWFLDTLVLMQSSGQLEDAIVGWKELHFCQFVQFRVSWEPHWQWASRIKRVKYTASAILLQLTLENLCEIWPYQCHFWKYL